MSQIRLVVRDAQRDLHGTPHGSDADRLIAALSAEPETLDELSAAMARFCHVRESGFFAGFSPGIDEEPYDAGLMVVDLAARMVVCDSTYSSPGRSGDVSYHDGTSDTGLWLRYHLPDDWTFVSDIHTWRSLADKRRRQRAAQPPLDARATLYGKPLLEFIAREAFLAFSQAAPPPAVRREQDEGDSSDDWQDLDEASYAAIREIHARWLTTPRDDLRGQAPRDVLLAKRQFIDWDMQHRCDQWSAQHRPPPLLDVKSHAYQYGGFGTHEIVEYYELVRTLLGSCREQVLETMKSQPAAAVLLPGDFLTTEVPRLAQARERWLDAPDRECHGITPREIIEHERTRLPEAMSGRDVVIDDDCPLCQMMADMPGPMFWHLDGSNLDDDFAFSFHRTRDEWEEEQRRYEEHSRRFNAELAARKELGVDYADRANPAVWRRSGAAQDSPGLPLEARLFGVGSDLAELIVDLKQPPEDRELIDRLSRDFGNLRAVLRSGEASLVDALFEPVIERFCETLDAVAAARDALDEKCADLQDRLRRFLGPLEEFESPMDFGDDEIPF
ncbi:MAG TPA: hypothetical protein VJ783_22645 [Pirellulales bacterium]|nr:hypothetical protein [Pirellulales bacterium]